MSIILYIKKLINRKSNESSKRLLAIGLTILVYYVTLRYTTRENMEFVLAELLSDQIAYRIRLFSYCICKSTDNYLKWLQEDYERRLRQSFSGKI